ncbi:helix-turn-helix transcriptional regulator [Pseudomonas saponiphila]|uniref:helix-turn-helix transcriptional regulator n=1 Tax=Pseudomonas saponiphila TaxID=556534 RepID=UPI000B1A6086
MAGLDGGTSHATCSPRGLPPLPSLRPSQPQRYLTNDEAADYLRLSPRTLEKQRVIGGGPKFRKFGRRVMYAVSDLDAWADQRSYEATSDPEYAERHAGDYRDGR